jgi:predicted permease
MDSLLQDVRFALRGFRRNPAFAAAALTIISLGIGANIAIFGVLKAALLREPFPEPDRLALLDVTVRPEGGALRTLPWSYPKFQVLRESVTQFAQVSGYTYGTMTLTGVGEPSLVSAEIVSASYFSLLGIEAPLGRAFVPGQDDTGEAQLVALLGHDLWRRRFGADPGVIGRSITLNVSLTVVGVLPERFEGLTGRGEVWVTLESAASLSSPARLTQSHVHWFFAFGRLDSSASLESAQAELTVIGRALDESVPYTSGDRVQSIALVPFSGARDNPTTRLSLVVLSAAVTLVLLIACANIAGLLLARGTYRRRETAIRTAVGASRWRLVRQLLTESVLLALVGGVTGLLLAGWGIDVLASALPEALGIGGTRRLEFLDPQSIRLDGGVFVFGLALTVLTGLLFGLIPAMQASNPNLTDGLKEGARSTRPAAAIGRKLRLRGVVLVPQIALALVLLISAGLMTRSLARLNAVEIGIDPENLILVDFELGRSDPAIRNPNLFYESVLERMTALPGVRRATVGCAPLSRSCDGTGLTRIAGRPPFADGMEPAVGVQYIGDAHFGVLGTPLLEGREFASQDRAGSPLVVIINETAARRFFPSEEPLGQRISLGIGAFSEETAEVVGVVGDVTFGQPEDGATADVFLPFRQQPNPYTTLMIRTDGDPSSLVPEIRRQLSELNPNLPISRISTMREDAYAATSRTRVITVLLSLLASSALALAAVGVYGTIAFSVAQRTRELGLRVALGARRADVLRLVMGQGALVALLGVAAGVSAAFFVGRVLSSLLYEVKPTDPATFLGVAGALLGIAALAAYLPTRKALKIDPMAALRTE